ncbi:uncharacterized protein LOC119745130 [Patiria miniata]|uniref:Uncharacterized protein n=1 Tax=Patiria miniata TaxID=46514 RepID=A0A914BNI6_PATMI|nr:uncharacterized protein LOC119745130 [Patiria miniata]
MTIQQKFKDEYNDPTSTEYKELENMVLSTIDNMFMNSDKSGVYDGSEVRGFSNGSVIAKVFSRFKRALIHATEKHSDLNKVLDVFVDEVKNLIEEFTSQPGCCNGLKFVTVIVNGANIEPPSPPQPADPATNPPTAAPTDPPIVAPTHPPSDLPTAAPTQPPTAAPTHPLTAAPTQIPTIAPTQPPTAAATQLPTIGPTQPPTEASTIAGCVLNSCLNNGTCQPFGSDGFICECLDGFVGTSCETAVFQCEAFGYDFGESETCDGVLQCPNGDDEKGCECGVHEYQCRNTICVSPADAECNGVAECLDYSDEGVNCNDAYCVEIDSDECLAILPYNTTYFPNDLATNNSINEYLSQLTTNCTDSERLALCMALFPECPRFGSQRRVCASLCSRALECVGMDTDSTPLHCDMYPDRGVLSTSDGCLYDEEDVVQTGDCGRRPAASPSLNPFSRIVGGAPSHIANWPWIGSYQLSHGLHWCGATLISPRWAVTAAHCGRNHQIVFGSSLLDTPSDYPHGYRIAQFFIHPEYDDLTHKNDIALVKLATPVRYTDTIQPACLETEDDEVDKYDTCHVAGWGHTSFGGNVSPVLKEASVPLISLEQCKAYLGGRLFISPDQICAGGRSNDTCQGDSGGPLVCRGANGRWKLVGITSTGIGCGGVTPGIYTRVSKYVDFIRFTIASAFQPCTTDQFDCGDYVCIDGHSRCDSQYDCINAIDEELCGCVLNSCLNNGTCHPIGSYGFNCDCPDGFVGTRCEQDPHPINLLENEAVEITSPSYPSNYQNNLNSQWIIQTAEDLGILLSFHAFDTERCCDYLSAGDGRNSTNSATRVFRLSGSSLPPDTLSTGNAMWLRFTSDGSVTRMGFSLSARSIRSAGCILNSCLNNGTCQPVGRSGFNCECAAGFEGTKCEAVSIFVGENETVEVTSPGYPDRLPREDAAIWIIQTDEDMKILVDFNDLTTDYYDYWKVGDGVDIDEFTFLSWSRRTHPLPNLLSHGSALWISLSFSYSFGTRGSLFFDVASVQYTESLTCSAAEIDCGHSVCINSAWRCDSYDDCLDGSDEDFCGCVLNSCLNNGTCQPIGRNDFNCECPDGFAGARCEIESIIRINLSENEAVEITSPSYPSYYQNDLDIQWIIQTAQDLRIRLSFHAFDTEDCCDYLEVGNGRDSTNSSTRVFLQSGSSLPPDTLSTGNAMWLRFTSDETVTGEGFSLSAQSVQPTDLSK